MNLLQKYFSKQLLSLPLLFLTAVYVSAQSAQTATWKQPDNSSETIPISSYLPNPVKSNPLGDCTSENIRQESFSPKYKRGDRIKMCRLLEKLRLNLWQSRSKTGELDNQVDEIWKVTPYLYFEKVSWSQKFFAGIHGHASYQQVFYPDRGTVKRGVIALSLKENTFPYVFLHELRHVRDLYDGYNDRKVYSMQEIEERAFLLQSYYAEATSDRVAFIKEFWRNEWRSMPRPERRQLALAHIENHMRKYYKELFRSPEDNSGKIALVAPNE